MRSSSKSAKQRTPPIIHRSMTGSLLRPPIDPPRRGDALAEYQWLQFGSAGAFRLSGQISSIEPGFRARFWRGKAIPNGEGDAAPVAGPAGKRCQEIQLCGRTKNQR